MAENPEFETNYDFFALIRHYFAKWYVIYV